MASAQGKFRPVLFLAASSVAPCTWTEVRRMHQPIGVDQWSYELALEHEMRLISEIRRLVDEDRDEAARARTGT